MNTQKDTLNLSIIIVSYNTKELTHRCLISVVDSLKDSPLTYEIIVVDNGSGDGSAQMVKTMQKKQIVLIESKTNVGFGAANNMAAEKALGKHLLFLNSDTEILDHAIEKLYEFMKATPEAHFAGPRLLNANRTRQPSAAPFFTLPVVFTFLFLKGDKLGITRYSPSKSTRVDWISGACIMCLKTDFEKTKGFDTGIFMYMEEVDLLYRAKQQEMNTFFYAGAEIIHIGSASSNRTYPILQVYQGLLYFYRKYYGPRDIFLLTTMLKLKAYISVVIGQATRNNYLTSTYEKALEIMAKH